MSWENADPETRRRLSDLYDRQRVAEKAEREARQELSRAQKRFAIARAEAKRAGKEWLELAERVYGK